MAPADVVVSDRPDFLVTAEEPKSLQSIFIRDEDERPKVAYNQFSKDIPVISLSVITGEERDRVRDEVSKACSEWGIFQVVDHGVPMELVETMTQLSRDFFALPAEEKLKYDMRGGKRGGFVVSSHLQGESVLDWREICIYFSYPFHQRDYSRWPVKPDGWREIVEKYSETLMDLACKLLGIISEALGLETESVTKACVEMDQTVVINFYPKCPEPDMTLGLKRHTDPVPEQWQVQERGPSSSCEFKQQQAVDCDISESSAGRHRVPAGWSCEGGGRREVLHGGTHHFRSAVHQKDEPRHRARPPEEDGQTC